MKIRLILFFLFSLILTAETEQIRNPEKPFIALIDLGALILFHPEMRNYDFYGQTFVKNFQPIKGMNKEDNFQKKLHNLENNPWELLTTREESTAIFRRIWHDVRNALELYQQETPGLIGFAPSAIYRQTKHLPATRQGILNVLDYNAITSSFHEFLQKQQTNSDPHYNFFALQEHLNNYDETLNFFAPFINSTLILHGGRECTTEIMELMLQQKEIKQTKIKYLAQIFRRWAAGFRPQNVVYGLYDNIFD